MVKAIFVFAAISLAATGAAAQAVGHTPAMAALHGTATAVIPAKPMSARRKAWFSKAIDHFFEGPVTRTGPAVRR